MYLPTLLSFRGRQIVNRLAQKIEHSRKSFLAHRNGNSFAGINSVDTSHKSICRAHGDTSYYIVAYMLSHLNNELFALVVYLNGIEQVRQAVLFKADINYRTNYLDYLNPNSLTELHHCKLEPALAEAKSGDKFQFVRTGFFTPDSKNPGVYNRVVTLRDSFKPAK